MNPRLRLEDNAYCLDLLLTLMKFFWNINTEHFPSISDKFEISIQYLKIQSFDIFPFLLSYTRQYFCRGNVLYSSYKHQFHHLIVFSQNWMILRNMFVNPNPVLIVNFDRFYDKWCCLCFHHHDSHAQNCRAFFCNYQKWTYLADMFVAD